jgi:hypothetical protein
MSSFLEFDAKWMEFNVHVDDTKTLNYMFQDWSITSLKWLLVDFKP